MKRTVWINADDFGWTDGHNQAVEQAYRNGVLNRASLLVNSAGFESAVELIQRLSDFKIGVHLTLNEGRPVLPTQQLPGLVRQDGTFYDSLAALLRLWLRRELRSTEVESEWRAQIEKALQAGVAINHLDSHKHVHVLPPLLPAFMALATDYKISNVRLPLEGLGFALRNRGPAAVVLWAFARRARNLLAAAGLHFPDQFYGIGVSGAMTAARLKAIIERLDTKEVEIMVHPAVITPAVAGLQRKYRWAAQYRFDEELRALCSPQIRRLLSQG